MPLASNTQGLGAAQIISMTQMPLAYPRKFGARPLSDIEFLLSMLYYLEKFQFVQYRNNSRRLRLSPAAGFEKSQKKVRVCECECGCECTWLRQDDFTLLRAPSVLDA